MIEPGTLVTTAVWKAGASFALGKLREVLAANDRAVLAKWDEVEAEFWGETNDQFRDHEARLSDLERAALQDRCQDHEAWGIFRNFALEATREALDERRLMIAHATAAIANVSLSLGELARAERVLRELDPDDVRTLRGLWLVRSALVGGKEPGRLRYELWRACRADALAASGCVLLEYANVWGDEKERLNLTRTGLTVLRVMRTYLATRPPPFDVPGHGTTPEFRTEGEAKEMLDAVPGLREACTRARGPGFEFEHLQFDPVSIPGRSPKGKAKLVFRHMPVDAATPLANTSPEDLGRVEHGDPVEKISIAITSQDEGGACVHVVGPFDVLRVLAYELDAPWS
ncbi:MAG: hypothetical protein IPM35_28085 [Myxococcales bacterium]|nr:hypothetical protein [Myxococcales bacterium]